MISKEFKTHKILFMKIGGSPKSLNRTLMTLMTRIYTNERIRENLCYQCHPCAIFERRSKCAS